MFVPIVIIVVAAVIVAAVTLACASGRIRVNSFAGIRIQSVMTNERTWQAGHRAAAPVIVIGAVLTSVLALATLLPEYSSAVEMIAPVAVIILGVSAIVGAVLARRAALGVLGRGDDE